MWTGEGDQLHVDVHTQKFEPTDDILFFVHAKKLAVFNQNFVFGRNEVWKFDIN